MFLYMSCFLFTDSNLRVEMLLVIVRGTFLPGLNYPEEIFVEEGEFSLKVEPDILKLFKKQSKIKQKKRFFN